MSVDLGSLVPLPALTTPCGAGAGLTLCPTLGLLVTSNHKDNTLSVFALPSDAVVGAAGDGGAGLVRLCTLGGAGTPPPMRFMFRGDLSGHLAFTGPPTSRLLLVTDTGHDAVHVVDVVRRVHVGHVAAPGTISGPRGVAARGSLVAVSAWVRRDLGHQAPSGGYVVVMFEGAGASWAVVRVVAGGFGGPGDAEGQLYRPRGLRFTGDGTGLAVADSCNNRVSMFRVNDGNFVRHLATGLDLPYEVEESEGGWLVACGGSDSVESVSGDGSAALAILQTGFLSGPTALALVPGLGLVVRELGNGGRVQFFATPDAFAMASMSACRVAWLVALARSVAWRAAAACSATGGASGKKRHRLGSAR